MADQALAQPEIEALLERGEELGCLNLSEVDDLAKKHEYDDDELDSLHERGEGLGCLNLSEVDDFAKKHEYDDDKLDSLHGRIESRGIDLTDDCGRSDTPMRTELKPEALATSPPDALQLFLNEIRRYPL